MRSIYWSSDDSKLISAGMDGAVYDWSLKDLAAATPGNGVPTSFKRDSENIRKSCAYTSAVGLPEGKSIYAVGSDKTLKV